MSDTQRSADRGGAGKHSAEQHSAGDPTVDQQSPDQQPEPMALSRPDRLTAQELTGKLPAVGRVNPWEEHTGYSASDPLDSVPDPRNPWVATGKPAAVEASAEAPEATADDAKGTEVASASENAPIENDLTEPTTEDSDDGYAVIADRLSLSAEEGTVYGPLTFYIPNRGVTILTGTGGSGRTALALTIAGRMKADQGSLTVLGQTKLRKIRERVAIAGVEQVDLLDRDVKVKDLLTEHLNWSRHFWQLTKRADEEYLELIAKKVFGSRSLPPLDAYVGSLRGLDRHLLRMAFAMHPANGKEIEMLVVDDLEQIHEVRAQHLLLQRVAEIGRDISVVVNAVNPIPPGLIPIAAHIHIDANMYHLAPQKSGFRPGKHSKGAQQ